MEKQLKKQIDDLLEYTLYLKNMFTIIAQGESYPDNLIDEDKEEIKDIIYIMDKALEIEAEKISKIQINHSDIDPIEDYLLKYYDYTNYEEFIYVDNELERTRVYNKLLYKYMIENIKKGICSQQELMDFAFDRLIDSNLVYVLNQYMSDQSLISTYGFYKYGGIFISPIYDSFYFPNCQVLDLKPITFYSKSTNKVNDITLIKYSLERIREEFKKTINTLYNVFTNDTLKYDENATLVIGLIMTLITYLSSSLNLDFIERRYKEFILLKKRDKNYSTVNNLILNSLEESKKIILDYQKKRS